MARLRVMTYNILRGGGRDRPVPGVVRAADPDVLVLQESPYLPLVWRRRCRALADLFGLRMVAGGQPAGSLMLLVRDGIGAELRGQRVLGRPPLRSRRGLVAAQLHVSGRPVGVVGCHLSLHLRERVRETERVLREADDLVGPVLVAGDLNERPSGPCWRRLVGAGFADHGSRAWRTFPARDPVRRIDALLVRGGAEVRHHGDPGVPAELLAVASDHRPVLAVLEV